MSTTLRIVLGAHMAKHVLSSKITIKIRNSNGCLEQVCVLMFLCDGFPFTSVPKVTFPDPGLQPSSDSSGVFEKMKQQAEWVQ